MGATHNGSSSQTGSSPQRSLFNDAEPKTPERSRAESGVSADSNMPLQTDGPQIVVADSPAAEPLWAQRLKLIVLVLFSVELGMLLVVLPWTPVWQNNSLIADRPVLHSFFQHFFTRGAITGLGLIDIWVGIWSAVRYREKK